MAKRAKRQDLIDEDAELDDFMRRIAEILPPEGEPVRFKKVKGSPSRLLKAEELARELNIEVSTVRAWTSEGRLPFVKLGKRAVRYRLEDVLAKFREASK